jgi:hypothetical protein
MASPAGPDGGDEAHPAAASEAPPARLRPGRVWYWVALGVFVAGMAWLALGLALLNGQIDSFERVAVPGSGEVSLDHSGEYVIYYEGPGAAEGYIHPFDVTVNPIAAPAAVQGLALDVYSGVGLSYRFGAREGTAVLTLDVAQPGRYLIETTTDAPVVASSLAVGSSIAGDFARAGLPSAIATVAAISGAIVIAVVRHSRAKRAQSLAP